MDTETTVVIEEYLQSIYHLQITKKPVKAIALAHRLQITPSTVHATLSRMHRDNLISITKNKEIQLTSEGMGKAKEMAFRHNLAECFLYKTLGISWYEVHEHAHKLEHALTPLVVQKLTAFLQFPEHCPHGCPLSGATKDLAENCFPLDKAKQGTHIEVVMIDESIEASVELLKRLHDHSLIPGKQHQVSERVEVLHSLSLVSEYGQITLPFDIANKIYVLEVSNPV
ncbi:metal-dependent transcriptional regulator [Deltaproteobacteria bacterium TL4]